MSRPEASARAETAAWAAVIVALLLFLFVGDEPQVTQFWDAFFNAGHTALFGVIALATLRILAVRRPGQPAAQAWWTAFWFALGLGAATELLQFFQPSRDPSFEDFSRDFAGAAGVLLVLAAFPRLAGRHGPLRSGRQRLAASATAVALFAAAGAYLASTVVQYAERDARLPTLFALDGSWWERRLVQEHDSRLVYGQRPPDAAWSAGPLARLDLQRGEFPGLELNEPYPDWRGYRALAFTVVSALDHPVALNIRIHDVHHDNRFRDRFNRTLTIAPGANQVVIAIDDIRRAPDRREMDLSQVRAILLFVHRPPAPLQLYLGPLRLE
jgi:VanZ family protein